ncbi:curli production assembly/transport component CsgF [Mesonia maritima]|uniref:Curli production assembly/transport component CsgF n=1 Tax=Mesonia maritima TaxID=1793873 RepID=A0ABU1K7Z8_9FLAO|nr:curli assembly protein CsgF [Mesonia maritima]MDR6300602.1 curli production assembly/transport component CsgF [Mesonia maritima]
MKKLLLLVSVFFAISSYSQQLTYKPINPAFGGDTFNYQWLLSSANAQNSFTAKSTAREQASELENFSNNLNRQLLSQLSRGLLTSQIGSDGLQEGTYSFGTLEVEVYDSLEGLVVNILDTATGEQTQVILAN